MRRLATLLVVAALALLGATAARADGDPASDFLYTGQLYPSFVDAPSSDLESELRGLLKAAKQRGYPIKVALIVGKQDLGQYPQLLTTPRRYATLLASEVAIYKKLHAPVVVVTANGFGVAGSELRGGKLVPVTQARGVALARGIAVPQKADGDALARAALLAVRQIAASGGHPLPEHISPVRVPGAASTSGGRKLSSWLVVAIVLAVFFFAWLLFEVVATVRARRARATAPSEPD